MAHPHISRLRARISLTCPVPPASRALTHARSTAFCLVADLALCASLTVVLRRVDTALAGAAVYTFLARALCPTSNTLFEWSHDPGSGSDPRCYTRQTCAALIANGTTLINSSSATADGALPCGWARDRGQPCIDPIFFSWAGVAGRVALSLGVWAYVSCLQHWPFKRVFALTQVRHPTCSSPLTVPPPL